MSDHWMHRQLDLSAITARPVDRAGTHPGELEVEGFPLGSQVAKLPDRSTAGSGGQSVGEVVGYYRGNLVVREPRHGTTVHIHPSGAQVVGPS